MDNIERKKSISKKHCAGLVMAGGQALRLGVMKHQAILGHKPLLAHVAERLGSQVGSLAVNLPPEQTCDDYLVLTEQAAAKDGPLAAVLLGLQWAKRIKATYLVTMPVDVPFFPDDFVDQLFAGPNAPLSPRFVVLEGRGHGLCALWPVGVLTHFATAFESDVRAVHKMHDMLNSEDVLFHIENERHFMNINTPDDLAHANRAYLGK